MDTLWKPYYSIRLHFSFIVVVFLACLSRWARLKKNKKYLSLVAQSAYQLNRTEVLCTIIHIAEINEERMSGCCDGEVCIQYYAVEANRTATALDDITQHEEKKETTTTTPHKRRRALRTLGSISAGETCGIPTSPWCPDGNHPPPWFPWTPAPCACACRSRRGWPACRWHRSLGPAAAPRGSVPRRLSCRPGCRRRWARSTPRWPPCPPWSGCRWALPSLSSVPSAGGPRKGCKLWSRSGLRVTRCWKIAV